MKKNATEIEYPDAPSGSVTFYNYKEPLMKFEGGFGYVGTLLFDTKEDKMQCHFCGQWFGSLAHHLAREHNMSTHDYKESVGLLQTTALISESFRAKLIASGMDKRLANLRRGGCKSPETREKIRATLKANALKSENMNLRGTCPAQLIERMQKIAREKGNKLRMRDFDSFNELIRKTFGSMKEACQVAGINYREPSHTLKNELRNIDETKETLLRDMRRFKEINNRQPACSDSRRGLLSSHGTYTKYFGSWKKAIAIAFK
jgi:hypothetical protein